MAGRISELLAHGAVDAVAIGAPDRIALTYGELRILVEETGATLAGLGLTPTDRVAIVLPNGPAMATSFLSVASWMAAAPLNPAYKAEEFEFYLNDLGARLLIVADGVATPAREAAQKLDIQIVELVENASDPAGMFTFKACPEVGTPASPQSDDTALVLHTSGTTSRPKIVPLSQKNLAASARNIAHSLHLTPEDKGLNIMPLFHIHGLIAVVIAPLSVGSSVTCTTGFNALKFFNWLANENPSWYSGVPTMHQAILSRATRNPDVISRANLRFVRSSSASLPPQVMAELEETFGCPVIEAYGMTEAAHQMACNPLPPAARKAGTVGIAAGPEIRLMDTVGQFTPPGGIGEIVIRGENVTAGYENNPEANAENFPDDPDGGGRWFRTGDQGQLDADGYLSITGRLKEIINRGGEKISPREVDEVLLDHPAVAQVVTFAIPHPKLGEDVAAAVVLADEAEADERDIRDFVAERLAKFKVPAKILILDEIPKGATGKLQRIGLAEKLGLIS